MVETYMVGRRIANWKTTNPECIHYNYADDEHSLVLGFDNITEKEVEEFRHAPASFYLRVDKGLISLLVQIGRSFRGNAFYSWWANPEDRKTFPAVEKNPQERPLVTMLLIERSTGILRAMRTFTWSPEFCRILETEIRAQATHPEYNSPEWYDKAVADLLERYPDVDDLFDEEVVATSKAGD